MSRRRGPRQLRPDEQELWRKVTEKTVPLDRSATAPDDGLPAVPPSLPTPVTVDGPKVRRSFSIGQAAPQTVIPHDLSPSAAQRLAAQGVAMDRKAFTRMKRGKLGVEARIDLHGMTLEQAHPRLVQFIHAAHGSGKRLVLVITGKGSSQADTGGMPVRRGILRRQVPQWLSSAALRPLVLQIAEAHQSHGGSGAYYVYLRRGR